MSIFIFSQAVVFRFSVEKVFLEFSQNSQENTCARVYFLIKLQSFLKKDTLTQVFSCEFCEISKYTLFYRTPLLAGKLLSINRDVLVYCPKLQ